MVGSHEVEQGSTDTISPAIRAERVAVQVDLLKEALLCLRAQLGIQLLQQTLAHLIDVGGLVAGAILANGKAHLLEEVVLDVVEGEAARTKALCHCQVCFSLLICITDRQIVSSDG